MAKNYTYANIMADLKARRFQPVYYLMGEEPYFIDKIAECIATTVLQEHEREFNQLIVYGQDTDLSAIITTARQFPMMAEFQVIIVKEAQALKDLDSLSLYLQKPMSSTILVFCHKNGVIDRRKKIASQLENMGVLFESKKLKGTELEQLVNESIRQKGKQIEPKAMVMLLDHVGDDISRLLSETDKLLVALGNSTTVTPDLVESCVGVSKEFNSFELLDALALKDVPRVSRIAAHFANHQKNYPMPATLAMLFNFFSNVMIAYYAVDKSPKGVAAHLGYKSEYAVRNHIAAMKNYSGVKVLQILGDIRYCDVAMKGVGNVSLTDSDLFRELIFKILH